MLLCYIFLQFFLFAFSASDSAFKKALSLDFNYRVHSIKKYFKEEKNIILSCFSIIAILICYKIITKLNTEVLEKLAPKKSHFVGYNTHFINTDHHSLIRTCYLLIVLYMLVHKQTAFSISLHSLYQNTELMPAQTLLETYNKLCENRKSFFGDQIKFFSSDNSIEIIPSKRCFGKEENIKIQIAKDALMTHAIVDQKIIALIRDFINLKSTYSTHAGFFKQYIHNEYNYIKRLLTKRPMFFYGARDFYALPPSVASKVTKEEIGSFIEDNMTKNAIKNTISYDEMCISALISLCSPTFCINDGNRYNRCTFNPQTLRGLYCGLVGARFEMPSQMEWRFIIVDSEQNIEQNGYGKSPLASDTTFDQSFDVTKNRLLLNIWASFYGIDYFPTYNEVLRYIEDNPSQTEYIILRSQNGARMFFNTHVYKKRLQYSIEPFLHNGNAYGTIVKKNVYAHAVGLGTGEWGTIKKGNAIYKPVGYNNTKEMISSLQISCYVNCLEKNRKIWTQITDIDFSYWSSMNVEKVIKIFQQKAFFKKNIHKNESLFTTFLNIFFSYSSTNSFTVSYDDAPTITIHVSQREPFASFTNAKDNITKIIIAMYAWDGNAFPGNEYYTGLKDASGDPAAACATTVGDLGNFFINKIKCNNIIVYP